MAKDIDLDDLDLDGVDEILAEESELDLSGVDDVLKPSNETVILPEINDKRMSEELKTAVGGVGGAGVGYVLGKAIANPLQKAALNAIGADIGIGKDVATAFDEKEVRRLAQVAMDEGIYGATMPPEKQREKLKTLLPSVGKEQSDLYSRVSKNAKTTPIEDIVNEFKAIAAPKTNLDKSLTSAYDEALQGLEQYHKPGEVETSLVKTGEEVSDLDKARAKYELLKASKGEKAKAIGKNLTFTEPTVSEKFITGAAQEELITPEQIIKGRTIPGKTIPGKTIPEKKAMDSFTSLINKELANAELLGESVEVIPPKVINDRLIGGIRYKVDGEDKVKPISVINKNIPERVIEQKNIPEQIIPDRVVPQKVSTVKTPMQTPIDGNQGARSLIEVVSSPKLIKELTLEDLQTMKTTLADIAYKEGRTLTAESTNKTSMAGDAASIARNKIDERIAELTGGSEELRRLKDINKRYGDLSKLNMGVNKEAGAAARDADKWFSKAGMTQAAKRGVFKGLAKTASSIPAVGTVLGGLIGMTGGAIAAEPGEGTRGAVAGLAESFVPESVGNAELPKSQMAQEALRKDMELKSQVRAMPVEEKVKVVDVLKSKLDYTPEEMQQVSEKLLTMQGGEQFANVLNQAAQQPERSRKSMIFVLMQQPAFREMMKKITNE